MTVEAKAQWVTKRAIAPKLLFSVLPVPKGAVMAKKSGVNDAFIGLCLAKPVFDIASV